MKPTASSPIDSSGIAISQAEPDDWPAIWSLLEPVFRAGDTYAVDPDISETDARAYWLGPVNTVHVAKTGDALLGTYYIRPNQPGGGRHVCNCGFITGSAARGKGVARLMLDHALVTAPAMGFRAMQFNFVVANNVRAIRIWQDYGFETVGRLPGAFLHPKDGYVDALVMYKTLV